MPTAKVDMVGLQAAMMASLKQPLSEKDAVQVVNAATSLILCFFMENDSTQKAEITEMIKSLGFKITQESVNRAALGHIAMMFPHLSPEMKERIIALTPTDL